MSLEADCPERHLVGYSQSCIVEQEEQCLEDRRYSGKWDISV